MQPAFDPDCGGLAYCRRRFHGLSESHRGPGPTRQRLVCNPDACRASSRAWLADWLWLVLQSRLRSGHTGRRCHPNQTSSFPSRPICVRYVRGWDVAGPGFDTTHRPEVLKNRLSRCLPTPYVESNRAWHFRTEDKSNCSVPSLPPTSIPVLKLPPPTRCFSSPVASP